MTEELQAKIEECQRVAQERQEQAEAALEAFFDSVANGLQEWLPTFVKAELTRSHEITTGLGAERLGVLKAELADIGGKLPQLVRRWLSHESLWPHRPSFTAPRDGSGAFFLYSHYDIDSKRAPRGLDEPLLAGLEASLAPFLKKYGYDVMRRSGLGRGYFPCNFEWTRAINGPFITYWAASEAHDKAKSALAAAVKAKGAHDVGALWDKA